MPNVPILYCGSSFVKSLYDTLRSLDICPILLPSDVPLQTIMSLDPLTVMISGSPEYVNGPKAPKVDTGVYSCGVPVLGICYGMQLMARDLGGEVKRMAAPERECVHMDFTNQPSVLFRDFTPEGAPVWMSHVCEVTTPPPDFSVTGQTEDTDIAAMEDEERGLYAVQFHPEHRGKDPSSQAGTAILWNFLNGVCGYEI